MDLYLERAWEAPQALTGKLPPVPDLDLDLLPRALRPMVHDICSRMQVPLDFPAVVAVATLAGICGRRAMIQPKALDDSWQVVPNLWGAIIADPGMMKSPVIKAVTAPAREIEKKWHQQYERDIQVFTTAKRRWSVDQDVWESKYKAYRKKRQETDPEIPANLGTLMPEPKAPSQRRLLTTDATFESLHRLLESNPSGIFVLRDELTGWLNSLEKVGRESERAFYLECWNGDSHFTVDRIGRGSTYVENCCVSLFGGIQPGRLRSYFANAIQDGSENDGLVQRFQLLIWPDKPVHWSYQDKPRDKDAFRAAEQAYRGLAELDTENPLRLRFSDDAQKYFAEWLTHLMTVHLRSDDLHPALESHFSKYRSLMPSLALLFSLADSNRGPVTLAYAEQAARWCDYLRGHAQRVYSAQISPSHSAALILAAKITSGKLGDRDGRFTLRDVYRSGWRELSTPDQARAALHVLEDHEWVRIDAHRDGWEEAMGVVGRPSERYEINPKVVITSRSLGQRADLLVPISEQAAIAN